MKILYIIFILIFMTVPMLLAKGIIGEGSQQIEVVVVGPYSGDLAAYGIPTKRAAELVLGKDETIVLNIQDDQCDPSVAVNVASNIISSKAVMILGNICSGATAAALDVYKQVGIAAISPSATNPDLTKNGKNTGIFFRTIAPDDTQGKTQAYFLVEKLGVKKAAVIHDKADYGKGLAEGARTFLKQRGVKVVIFEGITAGAADYSALVNKIAVSNVDAVVFGGYHPEASKLVRQLRREGVKVPFIGGDGIKDKSFIDLAQKSSEGVYATGPRDYSDNQVYKEAKKAHINAYSEEPGAFYYEGYAAAQVIKQSIDALRKKGEKVTIKSIKAYISDRNNIFKTSVGNISFDSRGDAIGVGFSVYQVKNGSYQAIN